MNTKLEQAWQAWLKTRPKAVRDFTAKHPLRPGDKIGDNWFLGFGEYEGGGIGLIVTPVNPGEDYQGAVEAREHVCANCALGLGPHAH